MMNKQVKSIDAYIKMSPKNTKEYLVALASIARQHIKKGEEKIAYGMPTITLNGKNFIHFAAMKGHLGFYPTPSGVSAFEGELVKKGISFSKGCIRFPYDKPLPVTLITKIIKFRLKEEAAKVKKRK